MNKMDTILKIASLLIGYLLGSITSARIEFRFTGANYKNEIIKLLRH